MTEVKIPRGQGYDKVSLGRYIKELDATGETVQAFARRNKLKLEPLCVRLKILFPSWWALYIEKYPSPPMASCAYCQRLFIQTRKDQRYCSRKCGDHARTDEAYFGGRRRETTGLAEGVCQCCQQSGKTLSSHHVWGKTNDPSNECLVALCVGCHALVTELGRRNFADTVDGWERLIDLVYRRRAGQKQLSAIGVKVMIWEPPAYDICKCGAVNEVGRETPIHFTTCTA